MIAAENLIKKFNDDHHEVYPVNGVSFTIKDGSFFGIIGRSGSGKTTLLKMLGGLLVPTNGNVVINGEDIYSLNECRLAEFRSRNIGFVFQDYFLEEMYTVYQNIEIVLMIAGVKQNKRKEMIEASLEAVHLAEKKDVLVKHLSGGEKQRVSIARAIVNGQQIIFADEPCGNLDYENSRNVMELFRRQCDSGKTVVLITHSFEDAGLTDEIIKLMDGKIIEHEIYR